LPSPPRRRAAQAGAKLADLIKEYASDLRRNSSGSDEYPWEFAKSIANYLEILISRASDEQDRSYAERADGASAFDPEAQFDADADRILVAQAGAADAVNVREPVPLADHDEIGRKIFNQPWEIQKAIFTIAAHCTVLTDDLKVSLGSAMIADLAGCISQCCLDLANALASPPSVVPDGYDHEPTNHMFECPGCGIDCADMNEQHKPGCPRATPSVPGVERGKDVRRV